MEKEKLEQMLAKKYQNMGALIVQKDGKQVYEYYQQGCTVDSPFHVFSVTKSVVSLLIGIAIEKGFIKSINQPVLDFFPDYQPDKKEKTIQKITLKDMMTMTAPYKYLIGPYAKYFSSGDWVKASLDLLGGRGKIGEFRYAPLIGPDIFCGILKNATGMSVLEFANQQLFRPLGIVVPGDVVFETKEEQMEFYKSKTVRGWVTDEKGTHTGGWGLMLTSSDMLKIGQLMLSGGIWNGERIISEGWIRSSTVVQSRWKKLGYGLLWWVIDEETHSFAALGDGGNVIYVNSKEKMVIVIASYFQKKTADRMKLIKDYIEPMFSGR